MRRDFKLERRAILLGLALLVTADVALLVYSWNLASTPQAAQDLAVLTRNRDLLRADVKRAQDIRQKIPTIQKDCDKFEQMLFPESTGYSSISAEIGAIAAKSGLQLEDKAFRQSEMKGRGLTEVDVETTVSGSYTSVVRFLNGLQRSSNVYAVESLAAKSEARQGAGGEVHVTVHIKTYLRKV